MTQHFRRSLARLWHLLRADRLAMVFCIAICAGTPGLGAANSPSFAPFQILPMGSPPQAVAIADLDGDSRMDLVSVTQFSFDPSSSYKLFVYFQNPDGTLASPMKQDSGNGISVAVGDVNGDGVADLVTTFDDAIGVRYGLGGRLFGPMLKLPFSSLIEQVQVADLNGDGRQDIVVLDQASANIVVFYQNPSGAMGPGAYIPAPHAGGNDLKIADMNGDGRLDVVISSTLAASGQQITLVVQRADGTFDPPTFLPYAFGPFAPWGIGLVDIDGNGARDIVATQAWNVPEARLIVLFNQGLLFATTELVPSYEGPAPVQIGDINLDGISDVVVVHNGFFHAGVYTRRATGGLDAEVLFTIPDSYPGRQGVAIGDLNGDRRPDLAIVGPTGLTILYNMTPFPPMAAAIQVPVFTPFGLLVLVLAMMGVYWVALRLRG